MAHWAEIDETNTVLRVLVTSNEEPDEGESWLISNLGGRWVQTSYNARIRKNFAGIGFTYHEAIDAFVPPQCHQEAALDETTALWICDNPAHEPPEANE